MRLARIIPLVSNTQNSHRLHRLELCKLVVHGLTLPVPYLFHCATDMSGQVWTRLASRAENVLPAPLYSKAVIPNFLPFPRGHIQNEVIGGGRGAPSSFSTQPPLHATRGLVS